MTAFLFIPSRRDVRLAQRVDFSNIGSLFCEADEPSPRRRLQHRAMTVMAMILITLCVIGDTLLIARPDALTACMTSTSGSSTTAPAGSLSKTSS